MPQTQVEQKIAEFSAERARLLTELIISADSAEQIDKYANDATGALIHDHNDINVARELVKNNSRLALFFNNRTACQAEFELMRMLSNIERTALTAGISLPPRSLWIPVLLKNPQRIIASQYESFSSTMISLSKDDQNIFFSEPAFIPAGLNGRCTSSGSFKTSYHSILRFLGIPDARMRRFSQKRYTARYVDQNNIEHTVRAQVLAVITDTMEFDRTGPSLRVRRRDKYSIDDALLVLHNYAFYPI